MSQILFYTSCGTLIRVGIIPVKLDRILTGIIRTYIILYILYCSTKPLVFISFSFERRSAGKFFTSILRSHMCEIIYTRFHTVKLGSTMALMWWSKNGRVKKFFIILVVR